MPVRLDHSAQLHNSAIQLRRTHHSVPAPLGQNQRRRVLLVSPKASDCFVWGLAGDVGMQDCGASLKIC